MAKTLRNKLRKATRKATRKALSKTKTPKHKNNKHAKTKRAYTKRRQMKGGKYQSTHYGNFDFSKLSIEDDFQAIPKLSFLDLCHKNSNINYDDLKTEFNNDLENESARHNPSQTEQIKKFLKKVIELENYDTNFEGDRMKEIKYNNFLGDLYDNMKKIQGQFYYILPGNVVLKRKFGMKIMSQPEIKICRWNGETKESTTVTVKEKLFSL